MYISRLRWNSTIRGRPAARAVASWSWCTARAGGGAGRRRVVVRGPGGGEEERVPAGLGEPLGEVALVVVDEEGGVHVADLLGGGAADQQRARLRPVDPPRRPALALHRQPAVQE